jgi:sulfur-oxidizing protein SoxY
MQNYSFNRRALLLRSVATACVATLGSFVLPRFAFASWNKAAFDAKNMADAYKALGAAQVADSVDVQIQASDIAENGAVVPIQAISKIPNTTQISILVEKNPYMLAALFDISPDLMPDVTTRIKMGQTSNIIVLVKAGDKYYTATKEIKVTLGGCGG